MTGPLFIEAWGGLGGGWGGPQVVKHHCVEMVQGSKGGSHSCSRNWNFKVPCPRAVPLLCVGAETDIWTQCLSPCTWPYAILARLLSPVGGPQESIHPGPGAEEEWGRHEY